MLEVKNLKMKFGDFTAVDNLSFTVKEGEILGLLGANGAGKTTTFRMILDVLHPTEGSVLYNNKKITIKDNKDFGFLAEERALLQKLSVKEQLFFFAELKNMKKEDIKREINYWLKYFSLEDKIDERITKLSKGNQQKIQLISAILHKPKFLILDEPFSGLDPFNIDLFKKVILKLKNDGCTIIFSSHRLDHVEEFCENVIVLIDGKDRLRGNITEIRSNSGLHKVVVETSLKMEELEALDYVKQVVASKDGYIVYLKELKDKFKLFNAVKDHECSQFSVELPTFEEVFVKEIGEEYHA